MEACHDTSLLFVTDVWQFECGMLQVLAMWLKQRIVDNLCISFTVFLQAKSESCLSCLFHGVERVVHPTTF